MAFKVDITSLKISLIIIIFCSGIFGVLSPRLFKPFGSRLSYASLLSSGVLLAAALVHLLGDAADGLSAPGVPLPNTADGDAFPWAYFFCGASFYFLYFFERFVIHSLAHSHDHEHGKPKIHMQQADKHKSAHGSFSNLSIDSDDDNAPMEDDGLRPPIPVQSSSIKPSIPHLPSPAPIKVDSPRTPQLLSVNGVDADAERQSVPQSQPQELNLEELDLDEHGAEIFQLLVKKNYLTGIVLLIGLGLHSFLAGVALGSSEQEDQAVALGIAIISHKYLAAFALGVPLYKSEMPLCINIGIALLFGTLTPMGIGVGWILAKSFDGWVGDMFVSIASGTFIYVSVCEVLIPEFSQQKKEEKITYRVEESRRELSRSGTPLLEQSKRLKAIKIQLKLDEKRKAKRQEILKTICVLIGFVVMSALAFWV